MPPLNLHYVEAGAGPLVVLLHGFPEYWYSWRHQIPALSAAGLHVVAPDLRGYNQSPKPRQVEAYRLVHVIGDVVTLIERLGAPCTLVGHDWGAVVAWYLTMSRPELVRKLAVLNIPHPASFLRELRRSTAQKLRMIYQLAFQPPLLPELLMPIVLPRFMRSAGRFTNADVSEYRRAWKQPGAKRAMANYYRALRRYRGELKPLVRRVDLPVMVIRGEHEPVMGRPSFEGMEEWGPNLRLIHVAGAGHFVQTDEPEIVNELLIDFALRAKG